MKRLLTVLLLGMFSAAIVGCEASAEVDDTDGDGRASRRTTTTVDRDDDGSRTTETKTTVRQ